MRLKSQPHYIIGSFTVSDCNANELRNKYSKTVGSISSHIRQLKELIHKNLIYQANNLSLKWGGVRLQSHKNSAIS